MKIFFKFKLIVLVSVITVFAVSCGNNEVAENAIETIFTAEVVEGDDEKTMVVIELEGMTCEVGCARYIKGKLATLEGVEQTEVNFDQDLAKVTFNPELLDEKQIVTFIHSLNDGQYKVNKINKVQTLKKQGASSTESGNQSASSNDHVENLNYESFRSIAFPNIFNIFKLRFF
jgi:periplasmic mercuric ion binding protein